MLLTILEILAVLVFIAGAVAAALNYLGGSTLHLVLQLWWQGSIKLQGLSLRPKVSAKSSALVQPEHIGGHTIFQSKHVAVDSSLGRILTGHDFDCVVSQPWFDWTADEAGDSHLVKLLKDVGYVKEAKVTKHPGRLHHPKGGKQGPSDAVVATYKAKWQAEIRAYTAHLHLTDGEMDMSEDLGTLLGTDFRVKGLVGLSSLRADAEERGAPAEDRWFEGPNVPESSEATGRLKHPLALAAASENVAFELAGWRTSTGILLRKPILASLQLTPDVASYGLAKLSPLLHCALKLEEGDSITVRMSPTAMHLPAECYTVRLEPMKLVLATRGLLHSILGLLNLGKSAGRLSRLEAWTTALEADIYKDGLIVSKRMDIVVGLDAQQGKGVHLAAWGRIDTGRGNAIDMTLGIPGPSLLPLGLTDLPEDYVFMIPMHGTSTHPEVDIIRAGKQLTELVMKQHVSQGLPFMQKLFKSQEQKQAARDPSAVPPPAQRPFPWEKGSDKASAL